MNSGAGAETEAETDVEAVLRMSSSSRCIICLSGDGSDVGDSSDVETGEVELTLVQNGTHGTPLMSVRTLCGNETNKDGICNCRYNIHTSCFVETNKVFDNVCPMCRKNWWCAENDEFYNDTNYSNPNMFDGISYGDRDNANDDEDEESVITCYIVLSKLLSCFLFSFIVILLLVSVFFIMVFGQ
jgi:hypothetical protein